MAVDAFLDFGFSNNLGSAKIYGESNDKVFGSPDGKSGCFHVKSCNFTITQKSTGGTGAGMTGGKAEFEEFEFTIDTQQGSPQLMQACAAGVIFKEILLHVRKSGGAGPKGGTQGTFLKYRFSNAIISSYATNIEEESSDTVKLTYQAVYAAYGIQNIGTGAIDAITSKGSYDIKLNAICDDAITKFGSSDAKGEK